MTSHSAPTHALPATSLVVYIFAAAALIAIGYALLLVAPVNPSPGPNPALLPSAVPVAPEPHDRFMFIGVVVMAPLALAAAFLFAPRSHSKIDDAAPVFWTFAAAAIAIAAMSGAVSESAPSVANGQWIATLLCVAAAGSIVVLRPRAPWTNAALIAGSFIVGVAILIGLRFRTPHVVDYGGAFTSHYEAVALAPLRIAAGGTCLADVVPQYGCFGEYVGPLMRLTGASVAATSSLFIALQTVAFAGILWFTWSLVRAAPVLLACLLALFVEIVLNLWAPGNDPILQYHPVRLLFPALSLLVVWWLQLHFTWPRAALAGAFGAMAISWNLETGVAVMIALGMFAVLGDLSQPMWASRATFIAAMKRAGAYACGAALYLAAFLAYLFIKSGGSIDVGDYLIYQITFYITGFGMIPMPGFPNYWAIHAALILAVLVLAALAAGRRGARDQALERATYLAILAIGLTLYYSGRSHWQVLKLVAWPDAILLAFLAERAFVAAKGRIATVAALTMQTFLIAAPAAFLALHAPAVWKTISQPRSDGELNDVERDIAFVSEHAKPGERITIFALNQSTLYGETRTRPAMRGPSLAEMLRVSDLADARSYIDRNGPDKLFVGTNLADASQRGALGADIALDWAALRVRYALAARGPGDRLLYLHRRPYSGPDQFEAWQPPDDATR